MKISLKSAGVTGAAVVMLGLVGLPGVAFADSGGANCWHQSRSDMRFGFNRDHRFFRDFRSIRETNTNDVRITNNNEQTATSGDATVMSRFGGTAISGDAMNVNETSTNVSISN